MDDPLLMTLQVGLQRPVICQISIDVLISIKEQTTTMSLHLKQKPANLIVAEFSQRFVKDGLEWRPMV